MNTIKRDVYVLRNTIKIPIEVTKGTDMVGIEFTVRDFNIPVTAAAVAYSYNKKMKKPNSQLCDVSDNVISFAPGREFFEVGMNELQIRVINENKALISFKEKVKCSDAMGFPDDEEEKQQTLIEQLVSNSGKETGERKKADETERNERTAAIEKEKSERTQADATEKSERKAEIDIERKRIDNLAKLPDGSTTGDAELKDIRVGADGTIYGNAGEAVRQQVGSLKEDVGAICEYNCVNILDLLSNPARTHNGVTCVNNNDGSYTLNGTATNGDALFNFIVNTEKMPSFLKPDAIYRIFYHSTNVQLVFWCYDSTPTYLSGNNKYNFTDGFELKTPSNMSKAIIRLRVVEGKTVSETVHPRILNALSTEELNTRITEESKRSLKECEKIRTALIDDSYNHIFDYQSINTYTHNGITYALNDDGSYKVQGTATADSLFNIILKTEDMPSWIKKGGSIKVENSSKKINVDTWFYDENNIYIYGPSTIGNYSVIVPLNTCHVLIRIKVLSGVSVDENVIIGIFSSIQGRRLIASGNNAVVVSDIKNYIHVNKLDGDGSLKIGNSNLFEITEQNRTSNNVNYEYDASEGSIHVASNGATANGIETTFDEYKSGDKKCHFAFKVSKQMWMTFRSNPSEWMSFDSTMFYQIYRNGTLIGYERGLGFSFLAEKGDEYGFRIYVGKGWNGDVIFKPQLNISDIALDYEVCDTKTYNANDIPSDIKVSCKNVSIINNECTYTLYYDTKETDEIRRIKPNAMISFIDDDTTSCAYVKDYHDIFEGTGVFGTYAVMTRRITDGGTDPDDPSYHYRYDNEGELLSLLRQYEEEGFGMVLHCYWQNDTHESTRYFNVATRDISKCRKNMIRGLREYKELGFQHSDLWVTPYGVQDTEIQKLAKELGLECLISMSNNTIISQDYRNRWCIPRYSISTTSNQEYLKEQMRTAVVKGGWINVVTHVNSWTSANKAQMIEKVRDIIDYAKEIGLKIGTFGECYSEWKSALYSAEAYND